MKILFYASLEAEPFGGSEQLWTDMAARLLAQHHTVMACVFEWPEIHEKIQDIERRGGSLAIRPNIHRKGSKADWISNKLKDRRWRKQIQDFNADLLFINFCTTFDNLMVSAGSWLTTLGIPYYILSNGCEEYGMLPGKNSAFFSQFYDNSIKNFFVARRNHEAAERIIAHTIPHTEIIKNPIRLTKVPSRYPSHPPYTMAFIARLSAIPKGFDILTETFAAPQWRQRDFLVNIYGAGPDEAYIRALISFRNLQDKLILKGFSRDIAAVWEENQLLLQSSRGEGMPLTILEANYCSRATVVTNVGDSASLIKDGVNGFIAETPTLLSFAAAMERAWEQREHWQEVGMRAHKTLTTTHDPDPVGAMIERLGIV